MKRLLNILLIGATILIATGCSNNSNEEKAPEDYIKHDFELTPYKNEVSYDEYIKALSDINEVIYDYSFNTDLDWAYFKYSDSYHYDDTGAVTSEEHFDSALVIDMDKGSYREKKNRVNKAGDINNQYDVYIPNDDNTQHTGYHMYDKTKTLYNFSTSLDFIKETIEKFYFEFAPDGAKLYIDGNVVTKVIEKSDDDLKLDIEQYDFSIDRCYETRALNYFDLDNDGDYEIMSKMGYTFRVQLADVPTIVDSDYKLIDQIGF